MGGEWGMREHAISPWKMLLKPGMSLPSFLNGWHDVQKHWKFFVDAFKSFLYGQTHNYLSRE